MLTHIHIKNYTIVQDLALDFTAGLNILTGETGAGKSIWVDAVALALGQRADTNAIRHDTDRCDITVCFDIKHIPLAQAWLQQQELNMDNECIFRRTINRDGRSRSTINGQPMPLQQVRDLAQLVLQSHGQHQQQRLLQRDAQRQALDQFANNQNLLKQIDEIYHKWVKVKQDLDIMQEQASNKDNELELYRFQHEELAALNLTENEWQELSHQHQQLHNAQHLIAQLNQAIELTTDGDSVSAVGVVQQAIDHLNTIKIKDNQIEAIQELLNTAAIHLQEASHELNHYRDHLDLSPETLHHVESRLTRIHDLARKHHVNPEQLPEIIQSLSQKIADLENIDVLLEALNKSQQQLLTQYQKLAKKLSHSRQAAAKQLNNAITQHMQALGMRGGKFEIQLTPLDSTMSAHGQERVEFLVCTNPGQALQPLNKVVSGGELSRISLALQVITAEREGTPTLIFDEVDTGVGGQTAAIVGKLLNELGQRAQILCITHLPQVAAYAQQHYKVIKSTQNNKTSTTIAALSEKERIEELARMLGGATITEATRTHAKQLMEAL